MGKKGACKTMHFFFCAAALVPLLPPPDFRTPKNVHRSVLFACKCVHSRPDVIHGSPLNFDFAQ